MTSDLVASSPITHQPKNLRYDVFLSFRGDDTHNSFVSHLHGALSNHPIKTFIDYNLSKGDDFPPAPHTAIEESLLCLDAFTYPTKSNLVGVKKLKSLSCLDAFTYPTKLDLIGVIPRLDGLVIGRMPGIVKSKLFNSYLHDELKSQFLDTVRESLLRECSKGKMNLHEARSHLMEAANISGWDSRVIRGGVEGNNNNRSSCVAFISPPHLENMKTETEASVMELPASHIEIITNLPNFKEMHDEEIIMPQLAKLSVTGSNFQDYIQLRRQSRNTSRQDLNTKSKHSSRNLDDATKDLMMAKILDAAGALRGRDVAAKKLQESNREAHLESRKPPKFAFQHHSTLVAATLLVTMTFLAALRPSSELLKVELINSPQTGKQGTPITDLFVLFNSTAFISLIVLIFSITQKLSVQPWFLFVEFSIVGAYVCSIMVITPHLVAAVLLIGGFILLVACFKFLGFHNMVIKWLQ